MITATPDRVSANTAAEVNEKLIHELAVRIMFYEAHPELIEQRLRELDWEWDIERMIETEAPSTTLMGLVMGALFGRKWLVLPLFTQSMMMVHALQGFHPLLPLLRRMGFRTQHEIAAERYALKAIRGAFEGVSLDSTDKSRGDVAYEGARFSGRQQTGQ